MRKFIAFIFLMCIFSGTLHGADANTELCIAVYRQHYDEAQELLQHGADANTACEWPGRLLHYAIQWQYPFQFIQLLIRHGAHVNLSDAYGRTALHVSAATQQSDSSLDIARLLVEHGASILAKDTLARTPLHYAANIDIADFLLAQGASVHVPDKYGWTPLHHAVFLQRPDLVKVFLRHGASLQAEAGDGVRWTPGDIARLYRLSEILPILKEPEKAIGTPSTRFSQERLQQIFQRAKKEGNYQFMNIAVNYLAQTGSIRCGMRPEEVELVLGKADNSTGIYCPGGYSLGYGSETPNSQNYSRFYWLHYRSPDWMQDATEPGVLIYWDMGDYIECPGS